MSMIEEMHAELKALCKRMDEAEGTLTICEQCGKPLSAFEAGKCSECNDPLRQMHKRLQAVIERLDVMEQSIITGYIYPKTLPADAVIVIRSDMRLMPDEVSLIRQDIAIMWPDDKCYVLHSGLSIEIIEGHKQ